MTVAYDSCAAVGSDAPIVLPDVHRDLEERKLPRMHLALDMPVVSLQILTQFNGVRRRSTALRGSWGAARGIGGRGGFVI